ncbi:MAG: YdeI/OmpD-associated family protein [Pseudomonadota bacterium]
MSDWISFEGRVVPMEWGDSVYTVLPLPDDVYADLLAQGAKRVDVELNDCPFNMSLTKAPVIDQVFVYTGKRVLAEAGIDPGEPIDVRMRKADPNVVDVPNDVMLAIRQAGVTKAWTELTPGKQRGMLHTIQSAKREETRRSRVEKLVAELMGL